MGKISGFAKRKAQKITPYNFIAGFILSCSKQKNTYKEWAMQISILSGKTVSRQSLCERVDKCTASFAKQLLQEAIVKDNAVQYKEELFEEFGQVLPGDSTTLRLPQVLSAIYPVIPPMENKKL